MPDVLNNPILARLEDQIAWYDRKSLSARRSYQLSEYTTIVAGLLVVVSAGANAPVWIFTIVGSIILLVRALSQLGQFQANWITYRSTCEALKHEKFLYIARLDPYSGAKDSLQVLAERVESLVSQEHEKWASGQIAVSEAVRSQAREKERQASTELDTNEAPVADELIARAFNTIKTGKLSGWEVAKALAEDPVVVTRALNLLRRRGLVAATGAGLDGYYYLTSSGFSVQGTMPKA